jgi:hypothetical protein
MVVGCMCKLCTKYVKLAIKGGATRGEAMYFLWNSTPFPIGEPTAAQFEELKNLGAKRNLTKDKNKSRVK